MTGVGKPGAAPLGQAGPAQSSPPGTLGSYAPGSSVAMGTPLRIPHPGTKSGLILGYFGVVQALRPKPQGPPDPGLRGFPRAVVSRVHCGDTVGPLAPRGGVFICIHVSGTSTCASFSTVPRRTLVKVWSSTPPMEQAEEILGEFLGGARSTRPSPPPPAPRVQSLFLLPEQSRRTHNPGTNPTSSN